MYFYRYIRIYSIIKFKDLKNMKLSVTQSFISHEIDYFHSFNPDICDLIKMKMM